MPGTTRRQQVIRPRCGHPMEDGKRCGRPENHAGSKHVTEEAWREQLDQRSLRHREKHEGGRREKPGGTLTEIKRQVRPGQVYAVTNHRLGPAFSPVIVRVARLTGGYGFYVEHALGESKVTWPPARHASRDEDGTIRLRGTGMRAGEPYLTLVPVTGTAAGEGN